MSDSRNLGRRSSLLTALAVSALVAVVAACSSSAATPVATSAASMAPTSAAATAAPTSAIPTGGSMTIALAGDINNWDPCASSGSVPAVAGDVLSAVYGDLVWVDTKNVVQGGMASSLTTTDAITWTLKLRTGLKFIDGHAYDADAVKYNWDRAANPANACNNQKFWASFNTGVTIVDPTTLTIKLAAADSAFAIKLAELGPWIASPAALAAAATKTDIKPMGAGPWINTAWNQGVSSSYNRNPNYWDAPRPYLDTLKFSVVPDTNARISGVVSGTIQFMTGYPFQFGSNATATRVTTWKIDVPGMNILFYNNSAGTPTASVAVRKAITQAINRDLLVQALTTDNTLSAPVGYFAPSSVYYDPTITWPAYDKTAAQAAFTAAAATATGGKLTIRVAHPNNSDTNRGAAYVMQVLNTFTGVTATDVSVPLASWGTWMLQTPAYDVAVGPGINVFNGPEPNTYNFLKSGLSTNLSYYSSTTMDGLLATAAAAVTDAAKVAAYKAIQTQVMTDLPFAFYGLQTRYLLMRDNTCGIVNEGQGRVKYEYLYLANFPGQC